jgi:NADH dehydrogenase FAD-containing subunit
MAGYGKTNDLEIKKYDNIYVCGDEKEEISLENPPLAPRVGIVSHMQADIVLEIFLKTKEERGD